jgi:hypothetical protein
LNKAKKIKKENNLGITNCENSLKNVPTAPLVEDSSDFDDDLSFKDEKEVTLSPHLTLINLNLNQNVCQGPKK